MDRLRPAPEPAAPRGPPGSSRRESRGDTESDRRRPPDVIAGGVSGRLAARLDLVPAEPGSSGVESEAAEVVEGALRLRYAIGVGLILWMGFILADAAVVTWIEPGPILPYLALRLVCAAMLLGVFLLLGSGRVRTHAALRALDIFSYTSASVVIALLCVLFKGFESPYIAGVPLVLACHTLSMADTWRRNLVTFGSPPLAHAVTMLACAPFVPRLAEQLRDPRALGTFLVYEAVIVATCIFMLVGGQAMHDLRQEVRVMRRVGRYRLTRRLGGGGMGEVWAAWHEMLRREVAVKLMKPTIENDATAVARFEREVRATAELTHPHTVRIFDYGTTEDGRWFYVMELLEGETLLRIVERGGPMDPVRAARLVAQAARALAEAHDRGIVHRDVKPENIFVARIGGDPEFVKVLDFGIAKILAEGKGATLTADGVLVGTPVYMSPEALQGAKADARGDVYALGAVLYLCLCARRPFEGATYSEVLFNHMHGTPLAPSAKRGSPIPKELDRIVMRAIAKKAEDRYQSARELAAALESFVAGSGG
jgi:serine/threonine-protein kinase